MAKILTINECLSDNIGDQAIAEGMVISLRKQGHQVFKQDFSCRKSTNKGQILISSKFKEKIPRPLKRALFLLKNIKTAINTSKNKYDAAIIGGGQLILSNSNFPWAMFLWVNTLKLFNKKVYIVCAGAGTEFSGLEKALYKQSLSRADKIFIRDTQSIATIRREFNINANFCPDIAYALAPDCKDSETREKSCIVCITDYSVYLRYSQETSHAKKTQEAYLEEWIEIVSNYKNAGYKIILAATTEEDLHQTKKLSNLIDSDDIYYATPQVPSFNDFMNLASKSEIVVAGRMHALILAHISGAKPAPYLISKKIESFSNEYLDKNSEAIRHEIDITLEDLLNPSTGQRNVRN